jgi:hypothetical protein
MGKFGVMKGRKDKKLLPLRSVNDCSEYGPDTFDIVLEFQYK